MPELEILCGNYILWILLTFYIRSPTEERDEYIEDHDTHVCMYYSLLIFKAILFSSLLIAL